MKEKKLNFRKIISGDVCQRSHHVTVRDIDVEEFEQEILEALTEED